jgi:hypothetical protein
MILHKTHDAGFGRFPYLFFTGAASVGSRTSSSTSRSLNEKFAVSSVLPFFRKLDTLKIALFGLKPAVCLFIFIKTISYYTILKRYKETLVVCGLMVKTGRESLHVSFGLFVR